MTDGASRRSEGRRQARMMKGVSAQLSLRRPPRLQADRAKVRVQARDARQQRGHGPAPLLRVDERLGQRHHAAALGENGKACLVRLLQ